MLKIVRLVASFLVPWLAAFVAMPVYAQESYPNKLVKIIVPFPPGGVVDNLGRALAQRFTERWGQPVILENRPGANTIIASESAAKAAADGYTLFLTTDASLSINPLLYKRLPYSPNDFVPISILANTIETVVVNPKVPVRNVQQLVQHAASNLGKLNYGSFGLGSSPHLAMETLKAIARVNLVHVPYKGNADLTPALLNNDVNVVIMSLTAGLPLIKSGKLRALAIFADRRHPEIPDVPTMAEVGYANFDHKAWFGLVAPAKTPKTIIDKIASDAQRVVADREFQSRFIVNVALEPVGGAPGEFAARLAADKAKYGAQVKAANVSLD